VPVVDSNLKSIVKRYTPTMLDVVAPAPLDEIERLETVAGPLPSSYREFLAWMGNQCPFLDAAELAYAPRDLLEIYDDPEDAVPEGFILIGIDTSGNSFDIHIRRSDGVVLRLSEYYDGVRNTELLVKNESFPSFLVTNYVQKTLVPSHPYHFAASFQGDQEQTSELWRRVEEACDHFEIPYRVEHPDFHFYGGTDFVLGVHQRPNANVVDLHFGAIERSAHEPWYDLVFARWRFLRMPVGNR